MSRRIQLNVGKNRRIINQSHPEDLGFVSEVEEAINELLELEDHTITVSIIAKPYKSDVPAVEELPDETTARATSTTSVSQEFVAPPSEKEVDMSCAICKQMDYTEVPAAGRFWHQRCVEGAINSGNRTPAIVAAGMEFGLVARQ